MPGPTSRDNYVGRSKAASLSAAGAKRAEHLARDHPPCDVCGFPMVCGQARSNEDAHFTCRPSRSAFRLVAAKHDEACYDCWRETLTGGLADHTRHR